MKGAHFDKENNSPSKCNKQSKRLPNTQPNTNSLQIEEAYKVDRTRSGASFCMVMTASSVPSLSGHMTPSKCACLEEPQAKLAACAVTTLMGPG